MEFIPYSCQLIEEDDIAAVVAALKSSHLTQGPKIREFEEALEKECQVDHAVALSSGTAALHLAMLALGIKAGKTVWTTPITFVATANAALYCGAEIDFVDIDAATGNLSIAALEKKLQKAKAAKQLPDLLVLVHYSGRSLDVQAIRKLSDTYNFKILEDAAHALGAQSPDGSEVGSCRYSDAAILSFHAVKSITTAEGGALLCRDPQVAAKCRLLRTHGITRAANEFQNHKNPPAWYYEQQELGFHYRLTDIQAALGISQLKKLSKFVKRRREIAAYYIENIKTAEITLPLKDPSSAWHLFPVRVPASRRDELYSFLSARNIGTNTHYQPVPQQPYYQNLKQEFTDLSQAEKFAAEVLVLPVHPKLSGTQQDYIISSLNEFFNA